MAVILSKNRKSRVKQLKKPSLLIFFNKNAMRNIFYHVNQKLIKKLEFSNFQAVFWLINNGNFIAKISKWADTLL